MALMLGKLYAALRLAQIPDDTAREAAEEVAGYEHALADMRSDMADMRSDITLMKWMLGTVIVLLLIVLGKMLTL
jgi:hypothetical protein